MDQIGPRWGMELHADAVNTLLNRVEIRSVGALADEQFRAQLLTAAQTNGHRVHIPSGAIIGLDALRAAAVAGLDELRLQTTKPAKALGVSVAAKQCVFDGPASESIQRFPRNVNVAVAVSIAGGREADVEIWADPEADENKHEVTARGPFGELRADVTNVPCPDNPRTSYLAALSVLALLSGLDQPLVVG